MEYGYLGVVLCCVEGVSECEDESMILMKLRCDHVVVIDCD